MTSFTTTVVTQFGFLGRYFMQEVDKVILYVSQTSPFVKSHLDASIMRHDLEWKMKQIQMGSWVQKSINSTDRLLQAKTL